MLFANMATALEQGILDSTGMVVAHNTHAAHTDVTASHYALGDYLKYEDAGELIELTRIDARRILSHWLAERRVA